MFALIKAPGLARAGLSNATQMKTARPTATQKTAVRMEEGTVEDTTDMDISFTSLRKVGSCISIE